jgi:hypothetical protein
MLDVKSFIPATGERIKKYCEVFIVSKHRLTGKDRYTISLFRQCFNEDIESTDWFELATYFIAHTFVANIARMCIKKQKNFDRRAGCVIVISKTHIWSELALDFVLTDDVLCVFHCNDIIHRINRNIIDSFR